jgi:hypothetical protein
MWRACNAESESEARVKGVVPTGLPHQRGREGAGGRELGQKSERGGFWAAFYFSFIPNFLIPLFFIFSIEFKSNQTTNSNLNISNMCINQK